MPDCSELKKVFIHVLSGLTYMSNDIIKKSTTYLDEVELLDSNSVDPVARNIKTLFERININLTQFGVAFDSAVENYIKERDIETVGTAKPKPNLIINVKQTEEVRNKNKNEVHLQQPSTPGSSNNDDVPAKNTVVKEENGSECDESSLQSFDIPAIEKIMADLGGNGICKNQVKHGFESGSFNFVGVDMNDELELELKIEESYEDAETELSGDEAAENNEIEEAYKAGCEQMLPSKSKERYETAYKIFKKWLDTKNLSINEKSLLVYFIARSVTLKSPASLWSEYSMLRATISLNHCIDISKFTRLLTFLKRKNIGYRPKKSRVFKKEEMYKFLKEAPDEIYLMMKVVMIMGITGACRRQELAYMTRDSIKDCGTVIFITIPETKTEISRTFTITNQHSNDIDFLAIFRKYQNVLPEDPNSNRFFLAYRNGKCSKQHVGVNTVGKIPAKIAKYLNLPEPESYTGRAFKSTSATMWHKS